MHLIFEERFTRQLFVSTVAGSFVLSLLTMITPEGVANLFTNSNGGATIGNSSLAAVYLTWSFFLAIILLLKSEKLRGKIVWGIAAVIMIINPVFIDWHPYQIKLMEFIGQARGGILGLIIGLIITVGVWLVLQKGNIKKAFGSLIITLTVLGILITGFQLISPSTNLHTKFVFATSEKRFIFWSEAMKGFRDHPILGNGPSTFNIIFHKYYDPKMNIAYDPEFLVDRTHNLFVETLVSGGILLLLALISFLYSIVHSIIKAFYIGKISPEEAALLIGGLTAWLIQAQFIFESLVSLAMLFIIAVIVYSKITPVDLMLIGKKSYKSNNLLLSSVSVFALFILVVAIVMPYSKARAITKIYSSPLPQRIDKWQELRHGSPMGNGYNAVLLFSKVESGYEIEVPKLINADPKYKQIGIQELQAIEKYLNDQYGPDWNNFELLFLATKFQYLQMVLSNNFQGQNYEQAKNMAAKSISLSPTDPEAYLYSGKIEAGAGHYEESKNLFEKALTLQPKLEETHRLIIKLAKISGDTNYYNYALERAKQLIPGFTEN